MLIHYAQGGFEATAKIREYERDAGLMRTPIVALTAHAMLGDREKCIQAQMDVSDFSYPLKDCAKRFLGIPLEATETEHFNTGDPQVCDFRWSPVGAWKRSNVGSNAR